MPTPSVRLLDRPRPLTDLSGATVLVAGFGVSGYAVADQTMQRGARVIVVDAAASPRKLEEQKVLSVLGADIRFGDEHVSALPADIDPRDIDVVVTSPGWRPDQPLLAHAAAEGIPVWSEIDLALAMRPEGGAPWLAVTGTNGKTTVVTMLESILVAAGYRAIAAGNVGTPLIEAVLDPEPYDVIALELSSFQLHWTGRLGAEAAAVLNISPDHIDWHGSLEAYAAAKGKIYEDCEIACVYNTADPATRALVENADVVDGCRAIGVTLGAPGLSELGVVDDLLVDRAFLEERATKAEQLGSLEDLAHLAPQHRVPLHVVFNALAAAALARAHGVTQAAVRAGLRAYRTGAHRIAEVARRDDVVWVDDSKATNPDAASASLSGFEETVWIAGGLAKGARMDELVARHANRLRAVILIGRDATPFEGPLEAHAPGIPIIRIEPLDPDGAERSGAEIMRLAVAAAAREARPGDAVLMAPACASMDQFPDYAARGDDFAAAAREITGAQPS